MIFSSKRLHRIKTILSEDQPHYGATTSMTSSGDPEQEVQNVLAAAKAGRDEARFHATLVGKRLTGNRRDWLFCEVERLLAKAQK